MQLSMHNFLLQYDGFHNLHFTTCGLMQADRNNSSSLEPSNLLSDTRCPCSHDWRKYMNQHHCHMHSSSVCSVHNYWARYCSIETPSSNLPAVSPQNSELQTFIAVADFGRLIIKSNQSEAHLPKCFISVTHHTTHTTVRSKVQQWIYCSLKISDSRSPFTDQKHSLLEVLRMCLNH